MSIAILFEASTPPLVVRDALVLLYGLDPGRIAILPRGGLASYAGPDPLVLITLPEGASGFELELEAGGEFSAIAGASELEIARRVCDRLGVRALVDDGSIYPNYWCLVTRHGSCGRVFVDPAAADEGELRVLYALEPIGGEPELPVIPPADWAKDW